TEGQAKEAMKCIMSGRATDAQIGSFLTALRMKEETVEEITAFARVMREFAARISPKVDGTLVDTCGTGGDKIKTFNVSTAAMFVVAGAGVPIAKHGNRSVASKAGSADVIEALGVRIDLPPEDVQRCIEETGIGFMFAPRFHGAMKHAIGPRREMGIHTVFNILGPLTNPAGVRAQVIGVYDAALTEKLARVQGNLGCRHAMVVHGLDGLDEISTIGKTRISELKEDEVKTYTVEPENFGIWRANPESIAGRGLDENVRTMLRVLRGGQGPERGIVVLNAAAAIVVGEKAKNIGDGITVASSSLDSGRAYEKVVQLVEATNGDLKKLKSWEASL
ncbi:MAG TPA: anthranilate phosphoribosyltransferase, partial [Hadesarchaea archaeon]|nr:anthranilate phosphoribosyltransferase [Hadesarchaea archaeon]